MGTRHRIDRNFIRTITPNGKYQAYQDANFAGFGIKVSPIGTVVYTYRWVNPDGSRQPALRRYGTDAWRVRGCLGAGNESGTAGTGDAPARKNSGTTGQVVT